MPDPNFEHGRYCYHQDKPHYFRIDGTTLGKVATIVLLDQATTYTVTWKVYFDSTLSVNTDSVLHFIGTPSWSSKPPPIKAAITVTSFWTFLKNFFAALLSGRFDTGGSDDLQYVSYESGTQTMTVEVSDPQYYNGP